MLFSAIGTLTVFLLKNTPGAIQNIDREPLLCTLFTNRKVCPILYIILFLRCLTLPKQALVFTCLQYKSLENTVGKGEIARYEQFLLFPLCFLTIWKVSAIFVKFEIVVCKLFQFRRV